MAAHQGQWAAKRKSPMQDMGQGQKYAKTDIHNVIRPQTSSYGIRNVSKVVAPPRDELSEEVAKALQSLRSGTDSRAGKGDPGIFEFDLPFPGPRSSNSPVYSAPHWGKSRHAGLFEEMYGDIPKPTDTDWTFPQRKQDSRGRGYYCTGKMNGNRKIWTRKCPQPLMWPPQEWLEEEAMENIEERSQFEYESLIEENNAVSENGTIAEDESSDEGSEQCAGTRDTGNAISDELKRKWMATGNFWDD